MQFNFQRAEYNPYGYDPREDQLKVAQYIGGALVSVIVICLLWSWISALPPWVSVPTEFSTFVSPDKLFQVNYPSGWTSEDSSNQMFDSISETFKTNGALIEVGDSRFSPYGTSLQQSFASQTPTDPKDKQTIQDMNQALTQFLGSPEKSFQGESNDYYQHQDVKMMFSMRYGPVVEGDAIPISTALGAGYMSEFNITGSSQNDLPSIPAMGLGTNRVKWTTHGYRATVISGIRRVSVFCWCPAARWSSMKPVFLRVIDSLAPTTVNK